MRLGATSSSVSSLTAILILSNGLLGSVFTRWHTVSVSDRQSFLKYGIVARFSKFEGSSGLSRVRCTLISCEQFDSPVTSTRRQTGPTSLFSFQGFVIT